MIDENHGKKHSYQFHLPSSSVFSNEHSIFRSVCIQTYWLYYTAALVLMLNKITHHLVTNPFVTILALDFSKAFDSATFYTNGKVSPT
jgi:hypothetical protein